MLALPSSVNHAPDGCIRAGASLSCDKLRRVVTYVCFAYRSPFYSCGTKYKVPSGWRGRSRHLGTAERRDRPRDVGQTARTSRTLHELATSRLGVRGSRRGLCMPCARAELRRDRLRFSSRVRRASPGSDLHTSHTAHACRRLGSSWCADRTGLHSRRIVPPDLSYVDRRYGTTSRSFGVQERGGVRFLRSAQSAGFLTSSPEFPLGVALGFIVSMRLG